MPYNCDKNNYSYSIIYDESSEVNVLSDGVQFMSNTTQHGTREKRKRVFKGLTPGPVVELRGAEIRGHAEVSVKSAKDDGRWGGGVAGLGGAPAPSTQVPRPQHPGLSYKPDQSPPDRRIAIYPRSHPRSDIPPAIYL